MVDVILAPDAIDYLRSSPTDEEWDCLGMVFRILGNPQYLLLASVGELQLLIECNHRLWIKVLADEVWVLDIVPDTSR